ncbi:MAG: heparinase II/III family protein [Anaerolineae bacterium]|nr:heparinase II/III family protein [Anaerolineae bacterium]
MSELEQILATLKPDHPRLIVDPALLARVRRTIETDPHARRWYAQVVAEADETLGLPPSEYEIPDGRRLLSVSRRVKERVRTLGFVHLLEGGGAYRERVWAEVAAAAAYPDWNPSHFLDTAEMTHALALAYDWLYDEWTDAQRALLCEAIISHGLEPAMEVYRSGGWWAAAENNWNQVCNGGIGIGALAIADRAPALAAQVLHHALRSLPRAMGYYAPDGAGTEGATYWDYGTRYNILFLSALESALGSDFGLSQIDGFAQSGSYQIYMSGADRMALDFGDCGLRRMSTAQHFWLGQRYSLPEYTWFRYSELAHPERNGGVLDLLWFDDSARDYDPTQLPLDRHYRKAECMSMRSAWDDPDALVVGQQGGQNRDGAHRHLDLGSYIVEALGVRWAVDSGVEREAYQRHRNKRERWEFYRLRAEGHNTLVIDPDGGPDQALDAFAAIQPLAGPDRVGGSLDLSAAYAGRARRVTRTLSLVDRAYVAIADHVEADAPVEVWWFMHTEAQVSIAADGRAALLRQEGKELDLLVRGHPAARFELMRAAPLSSSPNPPTQELSEGAHKVAIHLRGVTDLDLVVEIKPRW